MSNTLPAVVSVGWSWVTTRVSQNSYSWQGKQIYKASVSRSGVGIKVFTFLTKL